MVETFSCHEYIKIEEKKFELWKALRKIFERYDFLVTPTTAVKPFELGKISPENIAGKPTTPIGWMPFTYPFNFTGQPSASIPAGFSRDGLPVGMQITGRKYEDLEVLKISKVFQEVSPWQKFKPKIR